MKIKAIALLLAAFTFSAIAAEPAKSAVGKEEAAIRGFFETKMGSKIEQINKSPIAGLYEVVVDGQIMYVDAKASYFIAGSLIDTKTMQNITADKKASLTDKKLSQLTYENALKHVRGNGKKVLVTFEDPNCGYCKKLWSEIKQIKDVTVYTFLVPILSEDSAEKSKAIWCAADRNKSWSDWMMSNVTPAAADGKCNADDVLGKNLKLSQSLGIQGTPFLYFPASKQQARGYIPVAEIEKNFAKGG